MNHALKVKGLVKNRVAQISKIYTALYPEH